jgi:hypothetical protein
MCVVGALLPLSNNNIIHVCIICAHILHARSLSNMLYILYSSLVLQSCENNTCIIIHFSCN